MISEKNGKAVKGLGGLYNIRIVEDGGVSYIASKAKGSLKRDEEKLLIGDNVKVRIDDTTPDGIFISEILPRKNSLIRPPMANLDMLFAVFASAKPTPVTETIDKLIAIAEHNGIEPVIVITKADLDAENAERLAAIYGGAGFRVFVTSSADGRGVGELHKYIDETVKDGVTAAFAGASGVGKSTLMNALFPNLTLATAEISHKIERGKHTTRHVELFALSEGADSGFLADTPGFSLLDFQRFDFFSLSELLGVFREFRSFSGKCRYADCAHVGEGKDECAVMRAALSGEISQSRLDSYREIYRTLKAKERKS